MALTVANANEMGADVRYLALLGPGKMSELSPQGGSNRTWPKLRSTGELCVHGLS
jgi:hypothetical protein